MDIFVSQLTAYEKRRLNLNRLCCICNQEIRDYQKIVMCKRRDRRTVDYAFAHYNCACRINCFNLFDLVEDENGII